MTEEHATDGGAAHRPEYARFAHLFNEGLYFESHQVLEELWSENRSNDFCKGLMQMAGAYQHWHNESYYWAANLFRGAAELLAPYAPRYAGMDVDGLTKSLLLCADVARAKRNDRAGSYTLPPIRLRAEEAG